MTQKSEVKKIKKVKATRPKPTGLEVLEKVLNSLPNNFYKEYKPIPNRDFRIDFAELDKKVAIEFEGGIFLTHGGSHRNLKTYLKDIEKYNLLAMNGWRLFRVTSKETKTPQKLRADIIKLLYS